MALWVDLMMHAIMTVLARHKYLYAHSWHAHGRNVWPV